MSVRSWLAQRRDRKTVQRAAAAVDQLIDQLADRHLTQPARTLLIADIARAMDDYADAAVHWRGGDVSAPWRDVRTGRGLPLHPGHIGCRWIREHLLADPPRDLGHDDPDPRWETALQVWKNLPATTDTGYMVKGWLTAIAVRHVQAVHGDGDYAAGHRLNSAIPAGR